MKIKVSKAKPNQQILENCLNILRELGYEIQLEDEETTPEKKITFRDHTITKEISKGVKRVKRFKWNAKENEACVKLALQRGSHTFDTTGMDEQKCASYHSAICNAARRVFKDDTSISWTTRRVDKANHIVLYVVKATLAQ